MSGVFYGRETFDAQLIVAQMACMQALHYLGLGAAFFLMDALMGVPLSLDQFFGARVRSHGAQIGTARAPLAALSAQEHVRARAHQHALARSRPRAHHTQVFADGMGNRLAWATVFGAFLSAVLNAAALYVVVERAKKCLDFGATLYFWHIILCAIYGGLPSSWEWWLTILGSCVATILMGEYLCARREMQDITITRA